MPRWGMVMSNQQQKLDQRRAFTSGVLTGLAAPAMLLAGAFEILPTTKPTTVREAWRNVGQSIRAGAEQQKRRKERNES